MPIRSCYGPRRKSEIVDLYHVEPGPHCVMPKHQEVDGDRDECCGFRLTHEFYQFFYKPRDGVDFGDPSYPREEGSFFVGRHCADEFFKLLLVENPDLKKPRRFNPLREIARSHDGGTDGTRGAEREGGDGEPMARPTALNLEVMTVIEMLATVCRTPLELGLFRVLKWLRENPTQDTQDWAVFAVNDAVRRHPDLGGRTLRQAMDEERAQGADEWRDFRFDHIERILRDAGHASFIDPDADVPIEGVPATVVRLHNRVNRVLVDDLDVALFPDCQGLAVLGGLNLGDKLLVRIVQRPKGPVVAHVYGRQAIGIPGTILYVKEESRFGFLRPDAGGENIFIPPDVYIAAGKPAVGARLTVRAEPTDRQPRATWIMEI